MRRIIGLRKQYNKVFGRGSFAVIPVENQRVFAFIREYEERKILVTVNLSRFSQSFHLPVLEEYRGMTPVELFSQMPLPPFGDDSYHMMLGPHDFYWFRLDPEEAVRERHLHHENIQMQPITEDEQLPTLRVDEGIQNLVVTTMVQHRGMEKLEGLLPEYLGAQRWFGAQSDDIQAVNVDDAIRLQREPRPVYLTLISVETSSNSNLYVLPLTLSHGKQADQILDHRAHTAIAWLDVNGTKGLLHDAVVIPEFWETLFRWWQSGKKGRSLKGLYVQSRHGTLERADPAEVQLLIGEQSNSAAIIDNTYFVKLYRRIEQGTNPETELLEYLTRANFPFIPQLQGTVTFKRQRDTYSLGILQEALPVESDGWNYTLDLVDAYLDRVADARPPDELVKSEAETDQHPVWLQEYAPEIASMAQVLGIRTAELHLAMERAQESDMEPKSIETDFLDTLIETIEKEAQEIRSRLADENAMVGETPSSADWERALTRLNELKGTNIPGQRIRIHGDYHLGQVIRADGEFYILDFEGEPARSLTERRRRDMGLRDVAGMVRSIEYAILAGYHEHEGTTDHLEQWTSQLLRQSKDIFTRAYFNTAESGNFLPARDVQQPYLWMYLFQKVLYEVRYEFNHRPTWAWIPVQGLTTLLAPSSGETNITG